MIKFFKKKYNRLFSQGGFSLLETVLALGIGALLLGSLTFSFMTTHRNWEKNTYRSEMTQHARIAMGRLVTELRYADSLIDTRALSMDLQFNTTNMVDADAGTEVIRYYVQNDNLYRQVDSGSAAIIAGTLDTAGYTDAIDITNFTITPLKLLSGVLTPLLPADNISLTDAVEFELFIQDADGNTFSVTSTVNLRNNV